MKIRAEFVSGASLFGIFNPGLKSVFTAHIFPRMKRPRLGVFSDTPSQGTLSPPLLFRQLSLSTCQSASAMPFPRRSYSDHPRRQNELQISTRQRPIPLPSHPPAIMPSIKEAKGLGAL